jgi:hypothetical protein
VTGVPYYVIEPEVAGGFGERTVLDASVHPPRVSRLHYELEGWLGGEILTSFPVYVVTGRLRAALEAMGATGVEFAPVEITTSPTFDQLYPGRQLPEFFWMKVQGRPGVDDFGMSDDHRLVASQRAYDALRQFPLGDGEARPYS